MSGDKLVLDTNIIIDLFKGDREIGEQINKAGTIFLPVPVLAELYYGAEKSQRKAYHISLINNFLQLTTIVGTDRKTAETYSKIKLGLRKKGKPIPENDIWIAAIAYQYNLPVVTRDHHFQEIDGLELETW